MNLDLIKYFFLLKDNYGTIIVSDLLNNYSFKVVARKATINSKQLSKTIEVTEVVVTKKVRHKLITFLKWHKKYYVLIFEVFYV